MDLIISSPIKFMDINQDFLDNNEIMILLKLEQQVDCVILLKHKLEQRFQGWF